MRQVVATAARLASFLAAEVASAASRLRLPLGAEVKLIERNLAGHEIFIPTTGSARIQIDTTTDFLVQFRARGDRDLRIYGIAVKR